MSKGIAFNKLQFLNTLAVQRFNIMNSFPLFGFTKTSQNGGYWIGGLKPFGNGGTVYTIKIVYDRVAPDVFVVSPNLLKSFPHRYPDKSLCLYYPKDKSYNYKTSIIANTIIPWTAEWLYFYEKWLETGIWWGKEAPHSPKINKSREAD